MAARFCAVKNGYRQLEFWPFGSSASIKGVASDALTNPGNFCKNKNLV